MLGFYGFLLREVFVNEFFKNCCCGRFVCVYQWRMHNAIGLKYAVRKTDTIAKFFFSFKHLKLYTKFI